MGAVFRALGIGLATVLSAGAAFLGATAGSPAGASVARAAAPAADSPAGFYYGSDSWPVTVTGKGPYQEPSIGGSYGGYIGMAGNWARTLGCSTGNMLAWAPGNSTQANTNFTKYHIGIGTGVYWYMGGPGVDPHYNGTTTEANKWGQQQAAWALAAAAKRTVTYPVMWEDIELPGIAPAPDNGWNSVYSSPCSGQVVQSFVPVTLDRADFNGFTAYIRAHSKFYKVGVYSAPAVWNRIFGTGPLSKIPYTYEWTYLPETSRLSQRPSGWCLGGGAGCAAFFGGTTSANKYAVMWQWSGGGGITNGIGDFDQIDVARLK
jgi:hypothetical protein